jgi:hypothetical protein
MLWTKLLHCLDALLNARIDPFLQTGTSTATGY